MYVKNNTFLAKITQILYINKQKKSILIEFFSKIIL